MMLAHLEIDLLKRLMVSDPAAADSVVVEAVDAAAVVLVVATTETLEAGSALAVDQVVLEVVGTLVVSEAEVQAVDSVEALAAGSVAVEIPAAVDPLCLSVVSHTESAKMMLETFSKKKSLMLQTFVYLWTGRKIQSKELHLLNSDPALMSTVLSTKSPI